MKNIKRVPWIVIIIVELLSIVAVIITLLWIKNNNRTTVGWGDNSGGRLSYTLDEINSGILGNQITFNSISDSVIGDEKNFVAARINDGDHGAENIWSANEIKVENGKEYIIRLYVHNNSPKGYDAVSQNTRVAFSVPNESSTSLAIYGYIFSDNASPSEYWDGVLLNSDSVFHLEYVAGSALLESNGVGKNGGYTLSDNIVYKAASEHGVAISYSGRYADGTLDGEVPGCYSYASYITIKVKVVFDSEHSVEAKVRLIGTEDWNTSIEANIGDVVEFQIQYRNVGENFQQNVMIKDILPSGLEYIPGTTKIYNNLHDGDVIDPDTIVTAGINIGSYAPGTNAYVRFRAKVVDTDLADGSNMLVNWSQAGVWQTVLQDYAAVFVNKS